jgi:DNA-directed RNA polymerase specialized sigma24 family protein
MPGAFVVAYRMLGSVSEAEQVVQEAFLRLHRTLQEGERLESSRAYLSPVVTRLCIDQLRSARARRERYVGEWLPGPLVASADADPAGRVEVADSLSLAFLFADGQVQAVRSVVNPDKLRHLGPLADLGALLHDRR